VIFLGGREHTTVKELSEALGKETISMQTESRTRGQQESYGQNTQRLGKELMTVDELTTMDGNKCILQLRGLRPFFSPKYDLRKHPNYRHTAEADKKNAFDAAELFSTKLKAKPNDLFTVYQADAVEDEVAEEISIVNGDIDADVFNYDDIDDPDAFA
jgi:type IV secretion system protein VirD4